MSEGSPKADLRGLARKTVEDAPNGLPGEGGGRPRRRGALREGGREGGVPCRPPRAQPDHELRRGCHPQPKLKGVRFTTAIIERYRRRETSVEEAMVETCLAGVSTRRIEDVSGGGGGGSNPIW